MVKDYGLIRRICEVVEEIVLTDVVEVHIFGVEEHFPQRFRRRKKSPLREWKTREVLVKYKNCLFLTLHKNRPSVIPQSSIISSVIY